MEKVQVKLGPNMAQKEKKFQETQTENEKLKQEKPEFAKQWVV